MSLAAARPRSDARPGREDGYVVPSRPLIYRAGWWFFFWFFTVCFRLRRLHMARVPRRGPVILAANHASHLDPPLTGMLMPRRRARFVARESLFRFGPFGWLLRRVGAVPIRREGGDVGAMKAIIAELRAGEAVVVFPEGTRSSDGEMHGFKRGVALLLKRSECPVVPVGIVGSFDAWPRQRMLPRFWGGPMAVAAGEPIPNDELLAVGPDEALDRLRDEIESLRAELRSLPALRRAEPSRRPLPGRPGR